MENTFGSLGAESEHHWNHVVKSMTGWDPLKEYLSALPSAIVVYLSIYFVGLFCYKITCLIAPNFLRQYLLDFIKTTTVCAFPFGHGIMRKYYGEIGYMSATVPMSFLTLVTLKEGEANPLGVWTKYFNKAIPLWKCALRTSVQILAGFSAYHLGNYIMNMKLHPLYAERLKAYYEQFCSTDLNVPAYVGFLLEFFAVIYDSWFCNQTFTGQKYIDMIIKITNGGLLVVAGVHLTGMYIHPAMASGHTWGCGDTSHAEHIFIYWVGPMIATWISIQISGRFRLRVKGGKSGARKAKGDNQPKKNYNNNNNNNNKSNMEARNGSDKKNLRKRFFRN